MVVDAVKLTEPQQVLCPAPAARPNFDGSVFLGDVPQEIVISDMQQMGLGIRVSPLDPVDRVFRQLHLRAMPFSLLEVLEHVQMHRMG